MYQNDYSNIFANICILHLYSCNTKDIFKILTKNIPLTLLNDNTYTLYLLYTVYPC